MMMREPRVGWSFTKVVVVVVAAVTLFGCSQPIDGRRVADADGAHDDTTAGGGGWMVETEERFPPPPPRRGLLDPVAVEDPIDVAAASTTSSESYLPPESAERLYQHHQGDDDDDGGGGGRGGVRGVASSAALRRVMFAVQAASVPMRLRWLWALPSNVAGLLAGTSFADYYLGTDPQACVSVGQEIIVTRNPSAPSAPTAGGSNGGGSSAAAASSFPPCDVATGVVYDCAYTCAAPDIVSSTTVAALMSESLTAASFFEARVTVATLSSTITLDDVICGPFNVTGSIVGNVVVVATVRKVLSARKLYVQNRSCLREPTTGRPLVFHVAVDPVLLQGDAFLFNVTSSSFPSAYGQLQRLLRQGIMHGLAFSVPLLSYWVVPGSVDVTYLASSPATYPLGPVKGGYVTRSNTTIRVGVSKDFVESDPLTTYSIKTYLVTPGVIAAARQRFNCSTLSSVELEQTGFSEGLFYLEKRLFRGELMTEEPVTSETPLFFSLISAAVLEDTGWYSVSHVAIQQQSSAWTFGNNLGCAFATQRCNLGGWPGRYMCNVNAAAQRQQPNVTACGYDYSFTGWCNLVTWLDAVPVDFQLLQYADPAIAGADAYSDFCPYVAAPVDDPVTGAGRCSMATSSSVWLPAGSRYGDNSLCYLSQLDSVSDLFSASQISSALTLNGLASVAGGSNGTSSAGCFPTGCVKWWTTDAHGQPYPVNRLYAVVGNDLIECADGVNYTFVAPRSEGAFNASSAAFQNAFPQANGSAPQPMMPRYGGPLRIVSTAVAGSFLCGSDSAYKCTASQSAVIDFVPLITGVVPRNFSASGGVTITVYGTNLVRCSSVVVGGQQFPALYQFSTGTLKVRTLFIDLSLGSEYANGVGFTDIGVWCNTTLCPQTGCVASRLHGGVNITEYQACAATDDATVCTAQPPCTWNGIGCVDRAPVSTKAPPTPPPAPPKAPFDDGCTAAYPRRCNTTGACSLSIDQCVRCPPSAFQCLDSSCTTDIATCGCPSPLIQCSDGRCVSAASSCAAPLADCQAPQVTCMDGNCYDSPSECGCPNGARVRCPGGQCASQASDCGAQCPTSAPFQCWDGRCATATIRCRCPAYQPIKCWNGACAGLASECPCPPGYALDCRSVGLDCLAAARGASCPNPNATVTCADPAAYVCPLDLSCQPTDSNCSCAYTAYTVPVVQLLTPDSFVDATVDHTFVALAEYRPCDVDQSHTLAYRWSVEIDRSGPSRNQQPSAAASTWASASLLSVTSALTGLPRAYYFEQVFVVPAATFQSGVTYLITVISLAGNGKQSFSFARISTFTPNISVAVIGARRTIQQTDSPAIVADVFGDASLADNIVQWDCCVQSSSTASNTVTNASNCAVQCPALLQTITSVRTLAVTITAADGLPIGNFLFAATYKNMRSPSSLLSVVLPGIPACNVYSAVPMTHQWDINDALSFQAIAYQQDSSLTYTWAVDGTSVGGQNAPAFVLPAGTAVSGEAITVDTFVTSTSDRTAMCGLVEVPAPALPKGICQVTRVDVASSAIDAAVNAATAGMSWLRITATGWSQDTAFANGLGAAGGYSNPLDWTASQQFPRRLFRFGYVALSGKRVTLSADYAAAPILLFRAPVLQGNPSLVQVKFYVETALAGDTAKRAWLPTSSVHKAWNATCNFNLKSILNREPVSIATSTAMQLGVALQQGTRPATWAKAFMLTSLLPDVDLAIAQRTSLTRQAIGALRTTVRQGAAARPPLTTTDRSTILDIVVGVQAYALPFNATTGSLVAIPAAAFEGETLTWYVATQDETTTLSLALMAATMSLRPTFVSSSTSKTTAVELNTDSFVVGPITVPNVDLHRDLQAIVQAIAWFGMTTPQATLALCVILSHNLASGLSMRSSATLPIVGGDGVKTTVPSAAVFAAKMHVSDLIGVTAAPVDGRSVEVSVPSGLIHVSQGTAAAVAIVGALWGAVADGGLELSDLHGASLQLPFNITRGLYATTTAATSATAAATTGVPAIVATNGSGSGVEGSGATLPVVAPALPPRPPMLVSPLAYVALVFDPTNFPISVQMQAGLTVKISLLPMVTPRSISAAAVGAVLSEFTCMYLPTNGTVMDSTAQDDTGSYWRACSTPPVIVTVTTTTQSPRYTVRCSVPSDSSFVAVFDQHPLPLTTSAPPSTTAANRFAALATFAEALSPSTVIGVIIGVLGTVLLISFVVVQVQQRRAAATAVEKPQEVMKEEKAQVLLMSDLIQKDTEFRSALEVARVRAMYAADL